MANAAAAPAAATREESLWVRPAAPVLVDGAAEDEAEAEAEDEALAVVGLSVVEVPVEVESVLVAAEASVPVLVPVSVEELEDVELELEPVEQTTAVGRSVTPPRAQRDLATLRVAAGALAGKLGGRIVHHLLSWSSSEHLSATQHETSLKKDLASQMHLKSMPHSLGMAPVAQSFCLGLVLQA